MSKSAENKLIKPEDVILWVPGELTVDSISSDWEDIVMRGYSYQYLDVNIPAMRDYMVVNYKSAPQKMHRRDGNRWNTKIVQTGSVSLLTCGEDSRWAWDQNLEVTHVYISHDSVSSMANKVFDYDIEAIRIPDEVGIPDNVLPRLIDLLELELKQGGLGGNLYVESIKNQIALHLLRRYAKLDFKEGNCKSGLTTIKRRLILDFIHENIGRKISLEDLARLAQLSVPHFIRKFKVDFGISPAAYVMELRIQVARKMLISKKDLPIKVIASDCGFSDQSHMTRVFQKFFNKTPIQVRQEQSNQITQISINQ